MRANRSKRGGSVSALVGTGVLLALQMTAVHAGGLYVTEFGHPGMGASGAGAGALAEDASTALTNPAGIMSLDESQWMVTAVGIFINAEFEQQAGTTVGANGNPTPGSGSNGGDAGGATAGASAFYANPISEKWGFGVSLASYSGAILEYEQPQDFVGRYWAQEVELLTIAIAPTVAWRVSENFSLAVGIPIVFGRLDMDVGIPAPMAAGSDGVATIKDGDDIAVTGSISALWEINDRTRLGVVYLGENELNFDSDLQISLPGGVMSDDIAADVEMTYAQTLRLSGSRDINDKTTLLASVAWEDWSAMDDLIISTSAGAGVLPRSWDDTMHYAFGARVRAGDKWTWYTGVAYDTDPTRAQDRTADMPVDRQIRLSAGATWVKSQKTTLGGAITYIDFGEAAIDNGGTRPISGEPWQVVGEYGTNEALFVAFNVGWK